MLILVSIFPQEVRRPHLSVLFTESFMSVLSFYAETTAALHSREWLWPGVYKLQVVVADEQGLSCPEIEEFELEVCTCGPSQQCEPKTEEQTQAATSVELGGPALGLLLSIMCLFLCE